MIKLYVVARTGVLAFIIIVFLWFIGTQIESLKDLPWQAWEDLINQSIPYIGMTFFFAVIWFWLYCRSIR